MRYLKENVNSIKQMLYVRLDYLKHNIVNNPDLEDEEKDAAKEEMIRLRQQIAKLEKIQKILDE